MIGEVWVTLYAGCLIDSKIRGADGPSRFISTGAPPLWAREPSGKLLPETSGPSPDLLAMDTCPLHLLTWLGFKGSRLGTQYLSAASFPVCTAQAGLGLSKQTRTFSHHEDTDQASSPAQVTWNSTGFKSHWPWRLFDSGQVFSHLGVHLGGPVTPEDWLYELKALWADAGCSASKRLRGLLSCADTRASATTSSTAENPPGSEGP